MTTTLLQTACGATSSSQGMCCMTSKQRAFFGVMLNGLKEWHLSYLYFKLKLVSVWKLFVICGKYWTFWLSRWNNFVDSAAKAWSIFSLLSYFWTQQLQSAIMENVDMKLCDIQTCFIDVHFTVASLGFTWAGGEPIITTRFIKHSSSACAY